MKPLSQIDEWEWSDIRRYVTQVGTRYDLVVRSEPDRAGFSIEHIHVSFRPDGRGTGEFGRIKYINSNSGFLVLECERNLKLLDKRWDSVLSCLEMLD